MSAIDDGGLAFPCHDLSQYGLGPATRGDQFAVYGMTLRDWFATYAPEKPESELRALFPDFPVFDYSGYHGGTPHRSIQDQDGKIYQAWLEGARIRWRWHYADAMLKARSARP